MSRRAQRIASADSGRGQQRSCRSTSIVPVPVSVSPPFPPDRRQFYSMLQWRRVGLFRIAVAAGSGENAGSGPLGVTGNTPDSGSGEPRFETWRGNNREAVKGQSLGLKDLGVAGITGLGCDSPPQSQKSSGFFRASCVCAGSYVFLPERTRASWYLRNFPYGET